MFSPFFIKKNGRIKKLAYIWIISHLDYKQSIHIFPQLHLKFTPAFIIKTTKWCKQTRFRIIQYINICMSFFRRFLIVTSFIPKICDFWKLAEITTFSFSTFWYPAIKNNYLVNWESLCTQSLIYVGMGTF